MHIPKDVHFDAAREIKSALDRSLVLDRFFQPDHGAGT
jgi:hypothetical protein